MQNKKLNLVLVLSTCLTICFIVFQIVQKSQILGALLSVGFLICTVMRFLWIRKEMAKSIKAPVHKNAPIIRKLGAYSEWLNENVRGHEKVIQEVVKCVDRNLDVATPGKPIATFFFVGPTGTGKTFLAQLIGEAMFPNREVLHLRMNQYKHPDDVFTLLGAPPGRPGYELGGALTNPIKENPSRLIILDEIEKCHPDIRHCLFDILDTATCREKNTGEIISFEKCIFIATANLGTTELQNLRSKETEIKNLQADYLEALSQTGDYEKAFLSRWERLFFLNKLPPSIVAEVACLQLEKYWRLNGIDLSFSDPEVIFQVVIQNKPMNDYGVRQLIQVIKNMTEDAIHEAKNKGYKKIRLGIDKNRNTLKLYNAESKESERKAS